MSTQFTAANVIALLGVVAILVAASVLDSHAIWVFGQ